VALLGLRKVYPPSASARAAAAAAVDDGDGDADVVAGGKVAVADLWLRVPPGQILGLLGANGAGKTTTLSMLVGEAAATAGSVSLCGHDPSRPATRAMQLLGYCPQFDALFDSLTTREHVAYYAALNGTPAEHVPALVDAALATLDLRPHADTLAQHLSGGNRRRLSLVLAYVGAPRVVAIDEATTGVEPAARRRMFAAIQAAAPRRATVATTHLIEEAGALCGRIGIMVGGRLACLGSPAHLAASYGAGYSIEVSDAADEGGGGGGGGGGAGGNGTPPPALAAALAAAAPGARLVDANGGVYRYEAAALSLGVAFAALEAARGSGVVRDFSVCQTSLEAVFLRFSRLQEAADEAEARAAAVAAAAAGGGRGRACGRW
jgi:ABC-type multidrug transport system ATPase subunit